MGENSKIEWTDNTFNPWVGCAKVSQACDHCYAEQWAKRSGSVAWGPHADRRRTSARNWNLPYRWNTQAERLGTRYRVFCASLADVFDNAVPPEWRRDLLRVIAATQNLDWMLLTKRIGNAHAMLREAAESFGMTWGGDWRNVWIGATVSSQEEADRDIPKLLATPARIKFLSMEPLLGPVDISDFLKPGYPTCRTGFVQGERYEANYCGTCGGHVSDPIHDPAMHDFVDLVIVGGESGPRARPMHPNWVRDICNQCARHGTAFLFKQWGEWVPMMGHVEGISVHGPKFLHSDGTVMGRAGKKTAGRLLDGKHHDRFPILSATVQAPLATTRAHDTQFANIVKPCPNRLAHSGERN